LTVSLQQVAAPAVSPAGGTYNATQSVTISSTTSGASIRYTTDGSMPSETAGTLYSGPVAVPSTTTIKAIAYESGMADSSVTSATYTITITGLPSGWSDLDIGSPSLAGSASFSSNTFTVKGAGADIWGTSDQFHFAYTSTSGDVTVTARVASQQNTNVWVKSGVMIRETTAANSSYVDLQVTPGHGVDMQYRPSTGASAVDLADMAGPVAPYWVRLVRSGSTFTGYTSSDGVTWTQLGTISVSMATNAAAGLHVTSHNAAAVNTSTFDNVTVSAPLPPAAAPTFSPGSGTYSATQSVTISTTTSGASIRYTTDGSTPSETVGTLYSGPLTVSNTTTVKAVAYASGMSDSAVASATYSFGPGSLAIVATSESGDDGGGHTVAMTIDGNYSTYWQSTTDGISSATVQYDLGSNKTVSAVNIAWYLGNTRSTWFDVDTSTDGVNWTNVASTNSSGTTTALESYSFTAVTARYVRYVCYGTTIDNVNAIAETQIIGQ
jgi:regulation of enolase protein 1 (concanavalin A-like superfamily)